MNFSKTVKVFELNILRQMGVTVTPQQVGLKSDPIADLQAKSTTSAFDKILSRYGTALTPPTPPTPPTDTSDATAQATYNQELLAYTQKLQSYNQRFMQMMLSQMQAMQQTVAQAQQSASSSSSSASSSSALSGSSLQIGSILTD